MATEEKDKNGEVLKDFKLTTASLKNKTTVFVLTVIILIAGLGSYLSMPRESFPEVVIPQIYVGTPYPGNSAVDIEKLVTRPLEKEIKGITGIDKMTSTSVQGYSTIFIEFDFEVTPEEALRKVKDKVDIAKGDADFPQDLPADPNVFELNLSEMMPILNINLSGDFSIDQLNEYAEYLEDKIEQLPEITEVDIRGVQEKEMKVKVDLLRMQSLDISFNDIAGAIQNENITISGGDLLVDDMRRTVRIVGEFKNAQEIADVIVKREKGNIVYLKDIAEVVFEDAEAQSYAREYGKPVVMIDVKKRAGENLINASDKINSILQEAKTQVFPEDLSVTITNDQSDQTRNTVNELENSIIFGMLLVIIVLLFFLGLRNALFVGTAIPLSMFIAFFLLGSAGVTLNMMTLFSLILALGMLVDNGIVVVENIYRLMDEGYSRFDAAKYGVGEVAWPIIASTATTLAAFVPLAIWPGLFGEFMKYLPITLIIVLGSSLFVALVINPVFTSVFMKIKEEKIVTTLRFKVLTTAAIAIGFLIAVSPSFNPELTAAQRAVPETIGIIITAIGATFIMFKYLFVTKKDSIKQFVFPLSVFAIFGGLFLAMGFMFSGNFLVLNVLLLLLNFYVLRGATEYFQYTLLPWLEEKYKRFLAFALKGKSPYAFFGGTFGFLILSILLLIKFPPKTIFFPINQPNYVNVFIETPIGTDIEETNRITKILEKRVFDYIQKYEVEEEVNGKTQNHNFLVESVIAQVGEGASDPNEGPSMAKTPHKGRIAINFTEFKNRRGIMTSDVMEEIREVVKGVPGAQVIVDKDNAGPPQGKPINIEISGDDYEQLLAEATQVKEFIESKNIGGIEELKLDVEVGKPEMPIIVDRRKARRLSLSTGQIGNTLRTALFGYEVSTYKDGEDEYPIYVRLQDEYRYNEEMLMNQRITFRDQTDGRIKQVPISAVAKADKTTTFSAVKRKDQTRMITIMSNVLDGYNANEVVAEIKSALTEYPLPEENNLKFTGQQEEQAEELNFLGQALMIAVFLIFLILVSQFNSAATPFIIVMSVVFSLIGVFIGLVTFRMDFVVIMTMIGIISLAGIVVNNAIVLIDYTKLLMDRKREKLGLAKDAKLPISDLLESVVEGGKTRLRPVLLTAITTILGLLPLATGMNIDFYSLFATYDPNIYFGGDNVIFWGPMSWTVIFGLTFATFLTLVIVPVMFFLMTRLKYNLVK